MVEREIEEFCRRVSPRLVGALVLHCGDPALAEDVAQEALARAWERWDRVAAMDHPEGWVFQVAFNLTASHGRRLATALRHRAVSARPEVAPNEDIAQRVAVRAAILALPARQRATVVCRYYADLSVADTAEALGCAEGTVKALCHQGLARLHEALADTAVTAEEGVLDG